MEGKAIGADDYVLRTDTFDTLQSLIIDFLDQPKVEAGKLDQHLEVVPASEVLEGSLDIAREVVASVRLRCRSRRGRRRRAGAIATATRARGPFRWQH